MVVFDSRWRPRSSGSVDRPVAHGRVTPELRRMSASCGLGAGAPSDPPSSVTAAAGRAPNRETAARRAAAIQPGLLSDAAVGGPSEPSDDPRPRAGAVRCPNGSCEAPR
jgi:hypothetical protein